MISALFALAVVGLIVLSAEVMWYIKLLRREAGRKYIHILSALWVSFWPFFLTKTTIIVLSLILLAGVLLTRKLRVAKSVRSIERITSGDIVYPIGILVSAIFAPSSWIFCAAMLHIGLADGLAGLIGGYYNVGRYKVMGQTKSVLGTAIFIIASWGILVWLFAFSAAGLPTTHLPEVLILVPAITAVAENFSLMGIDNITVPLTAILLLRLV